MAAAQVITPNNQNVFDVVILSDLSAHNDIPFRIAQEVRALHEGGYAVGLMHASPTSRRVPVAPDLQACARQGLARPVNPWDATKTDLLLVHGPAMFDKVDSVAARVERSRTVMAVHEAIKPCALDATLSVLKEGTSFVVANEEAWRSLARHYPALDVDRAVWQPVGTALNCERPSTAAGRPVIGWMFAADGARRRRGLVTSVLADLPDDDSLDLRFFIHPADEALVAGRKSHTCESVCWGDLSIDSFLRRIDVLACTAGAAARHVPAAVIVAAITARKPVVLSPNLADRFGPSASYAEPADTLDMALDLFRGVKAPRPTFDKVWAPTRFRERVRKLVGRGAPKAAKRKAPRGSLPAATNTLFIPSNGVGLGHVARLLAVARRAAPSTTPVFASLAQTVDTIEAFGFTTEFIPSYSYVGGDAQTWDAWIGAEVAHLIDRYDAKLVLFDGSNVPPGLIRAALSRGDCRLAWMRRGMWGGAYTPLLENARWFDLIIEPGDIAAERDNGVTVSRTAEAVLVDPVRLLDQEELLSRDDAARALGIESSRPAVLVQLGAGTNRDILRIIDGVVAAAAGFPDLQVCIAEWAAGVPVGRFWPSTKIVRGFPLSRYFNAFDFSISAAGYNSFHELITFELPTIFIPNTAPGQDDQAARAQFAQDSSAAFLLHESELHDLPGLMAMLLNEQARALLRENCRAVRLGNGAREAALHIARLLEA